MFDTIKLNGSSCHLSSVAPSVLYSTRQAKADGLFYVCASHSGAPLVQQTDLLKERLLKYREGNGASVSLTIKGIPRGVCAHTNLSRAITFHCQMVLLSKNY